ncbi:GH25 family lysozyme [Nocardia sp. NPDC046473]|uniref:GH25 family lysozyme n=1 Tax=Nocardia sp. NPDC046473 TaxID=3155733 RepID=UPI0033C0D92E
MRVRSARISTLAVFCVVALVGLLPSSTAQADSSVEGIDVAGSQVNWDGVKAKGVAFAYIKATQGRDGISPDFGGLNAGATGAGLFHGAYHIAAPNLSNGMDQANHFVDHGGISSPEDGRTLPGAIVLQDGPKKDKCYGIDVKAMVSWLSMFDNTYSNRSKGSHPVIATTADWWKTCTGDSAGFRANPLWLLHSADSAEELPAGWQAYTLAQYAVSGSKQGKDKFNGSSDTLKEFVLAPPN